jgi:ferrous iron transport protein A
MAFNSNIAGSEAPPRDAPAERAEPAGSPSALDELPIGGRAEIVAVSAPEPIGTRLRDLGFVAGTIVELERRAPLGDPAVYVLRGTRLCLRHSEARGIRIRPVG